MSKERKSLGRGLSSIIASGGKSIKSASTPAPAKESEKDKEKAFSHGLFSEILIDKITVSPYQSRKEFDKSAIDELATSIASEGLINPILVRKLQDGYELIAGERRLRACKQLNLKRIVACVITVSDISAASKCLIENLHRSDLNPIEEALGVANLVANFKLTQDAASQRLGKPRSSIANSLRLLTLPKEIQNFISTGMLSQGHAKVLLGLDNAEQRSLLARKIIELGLNVRNAEEAVKKIKIEKDRASTKTATGIASHNAVIRDIENKIREKLNAKVELKHTPKHGKIVIEYLGNDDLQRILEIIGIDT